MSHRKNILIGYSGHAYVVADAALDSGINVVYYADKKEAKNDPYNLEYLGYEQDENFDGWEQGFGFILGIGNNSIRRKIAKLIERKEEELVTVVHSTSFVSQNVQIGSGSFIAPHVSVNAFANIGKYVILNTNSVVEHECRIASGVHIAPGAILAGNVQVGKSSFIGANTVVKQDVTIGSEVVIGAGSVIIEDIPNGKKIVGNPGREV